MLSHLELALSNKIRWQNLSLTRPHNVVWATSRYPPTIRRRGYQGYQWTERTPT